MKVLIGTESYLPNISGVAITSSLLAKNLVEAGHQVIVFAPSQDKNTDYETIDNVDILRLRSIPNPFRQEFRVAFCARADIIQGFDKFKPEIVHLQDPTSIGNVLRKYALKKNVPLVVSNHFSLEYLLSYVRFLKPLHPFFRWGIKTYLRKFYNSAEVLLCPTETVKKELLTWKIKTKIIAISNGVDLERFFSYSDPKAIKRKYHFSEKPLVLYLGRIDKDKNIEVLIKAAATVCLEVQAHFVIVGDGKELGKIKKMRQKFDLTNRISFLGMIDYQSADLEQIYQIASVFAIPSESETQSIVTLEAMASGLPVVAPNSGALPELVKNNQNGYLFEPGQAKQMAEKICLILKNRKLAQKFGQKSLEIVAHHQIKESFRKTLRVYEEIKDSL